jgi:hypothetical protein
MSRAGLVSRTVLAAVDARVCYNAVITCGRSDIFTALTQSTAGTTPLTRAGCVPHADLIAARSIMSLGQMNTETTIGPIGSFGRTGITIGACKPGEALADSVYRASAILVARFCLSAGYGTIKTVKSHFTFFARITSETRIATAGSISAARRISGTLLGVACHITKLSIPSWCAF